MNQSTSIEMNPTPIGLGKPTLKERLAQFPWWFVALILILIVTYVLIAINPSYSEAFNFIKVGLSITIKTTLIGFIIALFLGLITGLGRLSNNVFFRNLATLYVEFIRGVPMLVLMFFIAYVAVPATVNGMNAIGHWLQSIGWSWLANPLLALENKAIEMNVRAIVALSVTYGAFLAEIFRAGVQSVSKGQMEAARSQGMSASQAMFYIILPQAIRNVLPALGNDFVAMLKDSSLISVLAVRDITQVARLYGGRSFRYDEAYMTLVILYLSMTIVLSLVVKYIERRVRQDER
ncbi:MAG: amino acid ABC transporter [Chloroflexi bacterium HGW-Chloroflexi-2]|jgi:polar amino acid transport system permease protein|nr:MAG: amino acid ABC transporter [Chloroflexi bacterium HGW-Chloroflexi-2]